MQIQQINDNDIFVWPNGVWCYRKDKHSLMTLVRDLGTEYVIHPNGTVDREVFLRNCELEAA